MQIETNPDFQQAPRTHTPGAGGHPAALPHSSVRRATLPRQGPSQATSKRLRLAQTGLDEALEELHVQGRGGFRFGMPLHADAEPVRVDRLDGLDDAVGRSAPTRSSAPTCRTAWWWSLLTRISPPP